MSLSLALLALIVLAAFAVEAALGFGATVITVSLGAQLLSVAALLPRFVPLNLALSLWLAVAHRRDIHGRVLGARLLPLMLAGMPVGMLLVRRLAESSTKRVLGVLVVTLALSQLVKLRRAEEAPAKVSTALSAALLVAAGVVHGMFGAGGPLAVYVSGRMLPDKASFRATLAALWFALNAVLVAGYARDGAITAASLRDTLMLAPSLLLGGVVGEQLHRRVSERTFRVVVYAVLAVVGVVLLARR